MKRRTPWHLDQPRLVDSRISIEAPIAFRITNLPPIQELGPRQLRYSYKVGVQGPSLRFERRVERRSDEVLPGDLESYREQVLRARQTLSNSLRLPLVDLQQMQDAARQIEARLRSTRGWRDDQLGSILMRNEWARYLDGRVLLQAESGSALARQVMSSRAVAHNLLGDFAAGLADAEAALALAPDNEDALDAQAVALLGGARPGPTGEVLDAALAVFQRLAERHERKAPVLSWIGAIQVMQGRGEAAEAVLREALDKATGTEREFILIWLYLAAELRAGQGAEAVAPHGESVSADKLTGGILRYFVGIVSREELLSRAAKPSAMARLNLSEAHFFIGAQALVRGQREDALRSFRRAVDQGAVPYREHTFAELELRRQR
jgi:lipoprotein NlpI